MATQAQPYVGGGLPTNVVWVQGTTLFEIAANQLGNAMYWGAIAAINGLTDPWINNLTQLKIPIIFNQADTSGIFEPTNSSMVPGPSVLAIQSGLTVPGPSYFTVFSQFMPLSNAIWQGYNSRQVISPSILVPPASGNPIGARVTFQFATSTSSGKLDSAWVGTGATVGNSYNFIGDQVQLTFGGLTSITGINGSQTFVSDTASFTSFNAVNPLVVSMHFSGTSVAGLATNNNVTGARNWYFLGSDVSGQTAPSGSWTSLPNQSVFVSLVEIKTSP